MDVNIQQNNGDKIESDGEDDEVLAGMDVNIEEQDVRPKQARKLTPCNEDNSNARHRSIGTWIDVTAGFIIVWLGAILILGATKLRSAELMYCTKYGLNIASVQNAIGHDAFQQGAPGCNPLQKVAPVLNSVTVALAGAWILGKHICVDESMIKYTGRVISFIQYMPVKPIKHGIKVFALCCAYTGYLYHFEIYTGKESQFDGPPGEVVKRLLLGAKIGTSKDRILYTDNFYTSLGVMTYLYLAFNMLLVGNTN
jgi:hypothetical protein